MANRVRNFGAGPAALPLPVLEQIRDELLDFRGTGMSILESSHRGPAYSEIHEEAMTNLRRLLEAGEEYEILFMTGGARTQFSLVAMNLLTRGSRADYVTTGRWSELALDAGRRFGAVREIWTSAPHGHDRVPGDDELAPDPRAAFVHYTSNNTIYGTQYHRVPESGGAPLVCDMSSDILSWPLDVSRFGVIYAGAQKNLGPAGVTVVVVRRDLLERSEPSLPETMSYAAMAAKRSLVNTPPVFSIYGLALVTRHWLSQGGVREIERRNREKAELLYAAIDGSEGFYRGHARPDSRSRMNVTFNLPTPELEASFLTGAAAEGLAALKGHRSVGGVRASIYNVAELEGVRELAAFMNDFRARNG
ncbi:MAG: 3-phosphoserine/phosphohydroxythreonine transaminase [Thermoanaerobaculia bacterium]|nr:3-phosphoserine/phosphohydroxythreonine transaminase [Thermoanaerobaculia bacterium]